MATVTESQGPPKITSDQFFALAEAGVFDNDQRVFLWDGRIIAKMAKTVPHAMTAVRIADLIRPRLPQGWFICPEGPIQLGRWNAPLPDVAVVRGTTETYQDKNHHPSAEDLGLVVEVSFTSLARDLGIRSEQFATANVPVYWVADIQGRRIIEHREPQIVDGIGNYASVKIYGHTDEIDVILDGQSIAKLPIAAMLR
jgi:Uma2 family endonuclease